MALAILGGNPRRFKPLVDLYRQAGIEAGHSPEHLKVGVTGHAYIAETTQLAKDEFYPYYSNYWYYVNRQRGMGTKMSRDDFEQMAARIRHFLSEVQSKLLKKSFDNMSCLAIPDSLLK